MKEIRKMLIGKTMIGKATKVTRLNRSRRKRTNKREVVVGRGVKNGKENKVDANTNKQESEKRVAKTRKEENGKTKENQTSIK